MTTLHSKGFMFAALVLSAAVGLTNCGGSSTSPPDPSGGLSFNATSSPPASNSIALTEMSRSGSSVTVAVVATSVNDLFGLGFQLVWDPNVVNWQTATEGAFLNQGGAQTSFLANLHDVQPGPGTDMRQGRLDVGITRVGAVPGAGGSGTLLTLTFTAVGSGSTGISFEGFAALNSSGNTVPGLSFSGGTFATQ